MTREKQDVTEDRNCKIWVKKKSLSVCANRTSARTTEKFTKISVNFNRNKRNETKERKKKKYPTNEDVE